MFHRLVDPLQSNSFFLFGPRGSGKSTFLMEFFSGHSTLWIDLLDPEEEERYALAPDLLLNKLQSLQPRPEWVVIDEIQKSPKLLDVVHLSIERYHQKFALTGSSARKLKRGAANLLAGRAFVYHMFPLTHVEMGAQFDLDLALSWGTLPKITHFNTDEEKTEYLNAYARTYLKEEVWAEQLIRHLNPFRRFLEISVQANGEILNYSSIARDVGVDYKTVQTYYQILEDTMLGFFIEPHHRSIRKQQRQSPKFYWFDTGVARALNRTLGQTVTPQTYGYGKLFEQFLVAEITRLATYRRKEYRFSYLKTKDQLEIDLIIDRPGLPIALLEIKSTSRAKAQDAASLNHVIGDFPSAEGFVLSQDPHEQKIDRVWFLPWQKGLAELGI
jgi:predicted AAA+ superfamily ATPase